MKTVNDIQKHILNILLDKYERSKTFRGDNKVNQKISIKPENVYPAYVDDSQYEVFQKVNEAVKELELLNIVQVVRLSNGIISKITLNIEQLDAGYQMCNRIPKKHIYTQLQKLWRDFLSSITEENIACIFQAYISEQEMRINHNKQVAFFDGDFQAYEEFLQAIYKILKNDTEQYIRDFSVQLFGNSKKLHSMEERIRSFLYEYGECTKKENALEEYGIVKNPTYVSVKGKAIIKIGDQTLDLSQIQGDISFSTVSLMQINQIKITGNQVVTIENLTSFHTFREQDSFVIYLGGFHNSVKRNFLKKLYADNSDKKYLHFGDMDAGGFYIYQHLVRLSGIPFELLAMDVTTLKKYEEAWQELSANDRKRIQSLISKEESKPYQKVLQFMLEHNCKLEQEAVKI